MEPHRSGWRWWISALVAMLVLVIVLVLVIYVAALTLRWLGL